MKYILFSTKTTIENFKNDINNLLEVTEIEFDLFEFVNSSKLEDILSMAIKWNGFTEIDENDFKDLCLHKQSLMDYKDSLIKKLNNTCKNVFNNST